MVMPALARNCMGDQYNLSRQQCVEKIVQKAFLNALHDLLAIDHVHLRMDRTIGQVVPDCRIDGAVNTRSKSFDSNDLQSFS